MTSDTDHPSGQIERITPASHPEATGGWPSPRYHELVEILRGYRGEAIFFSRVAFNGGFIKEGQPYRLLEVAPYPAPRDHPNPNKRAYPHMLVLESVRPPDTPDDYWRNGLYHGGAINLAHVGAITTAAFPTGPDQFLYANLQLLAFYYGKAPRTLLTEGVVPQRICAEHDRLSEALDALDQGDPQ